MNLLILSFHTACVPRGTDKDRRSLICRNSRKDGGGPSKAALQGEAWGLRCQVSVYDPGDSASRIA